YGPAGKCCIQGPDPSPDSAAGFTSLREYERHLVSRHLKQQTATTVYSNGPVKALADPAISPPSSRWSVYNSVVNLPAVLNDPTYRQLTVRLLVSVHRKIHHSFPLFLQMAGN
ncbi:hypothetical protein FGIG_05568, partial [Fasciola gigantica]